MSSRDVSWVDRLLEGAVWGAPLVVLLPFAWLLGDLAYRGTDAFAGDVDRPISFAGAIETLGQVVAFLTSEPESAGREGGIGPILVSTGLILAVCLAAAFPIGMGSAILLAEFVSSENGFGFIVRRSLDVLAGAPSIVLGLFGNAFFCRALGLKFSILAGGLTLACMVLPFMIRAAEEALRSIPDAQRHAAAAAGFSRCSIVFRVLLPQAGTGIAVGLILSIGRSLAETAALIFTSGYVDRMPRSLLDSGRALSIHVYDLSMNVAGGDKNAYASALVLVTALAAINVIARRLTSRVFRADDGGATA